MFTNWLDKLPYILVFFKIPNWIFPCFNVKNNHFLFIWWSNFNRSSPLYLKSILDRISMFSFSWSNKRIHFGEILPQSASRIAYNEYVNRVSPHKSFVFPHSVCWTAILFIDSPFSFSSFVSSNSPREIKFYSFTLPLAYYIRVAWHLHRLSCFSYRLPFLVSKKLSALLHLRNF